MVAETEKNPAKVRAGQAGNASRWHGQVAQVRLDGLTVEQRQLIIAIVQAIRIKNTEPVP